MRGAACTQNPPPPTSRAMQREYGLGGARTAHAAKNIPCDAVQWKGRKRISLLGGNFRERGVIERRSGEGVCTILPYPSQTMPPAQRKSARRSCTEAAGLLLPVRHFSRRAKKLGFERLAKQTPVAIAAIVEHVLVELLRCGVWVTLGCNRKRVVAKDLAIAIAGNQALEALFRNQLIMQAPPEL